MATFQTASLLNIIEQGQKIESVFVGVLLETAMKLSSITDANILVVVDTSHGRKWVGRRSLKEEFMEGRLRLGSKDEEIFVEGVANNDPTNVAGFGEELIVGGLNLATPTTSSTSDLEAAASKAVLKTSPTPSSTPINFSMSSSTRDRQSSSASLSAPLTVKTSPTPHESAVDGTASSSLSMESAFKENNFNTTKLVGSQKRKRRASQTSMQDKKLRGESVERPEPEVDAASTSTSAFNAKRFLDDVARKLAGGGAATSLIESHGQQDSPRSDAEISDLFNAESSNNNNNYESKAPVEKSEPTFSSAAKNKDHGFRGMSSPLDHSGPNGSFIRHASPSPSAEAFEGLESDAATMGGNFFQEQIKTMLRADMSVEEISYHLKVPPSIVNYWIQLMVPSMKDGESSDKHSSKSSTNNNSGGSNAFGNTAASTTGGASSIEGANKTTPGRRSGKLDKDSLKQLIDSNKSIREIADVLGVHPTTVYRAMKSYDLSLPGHNTTPTGNTHGAGSKSATASSKSPMALVPYGNVETQQQQQQGDAATPSAAPATGQRVRLKRDRLQLLKTLILSGATVRECANILGVHHTTIYRAMRNLNIDPQLTQIPKAPGSSPASSGVTGISPTDLAAEMAAGSSLLQHFPAFADPTQMRRWMDPATAAAAAAANYMGGIGSLANVYNQAAFHDLASASGAAASAGSPLDYLASFPPRSSVGGEEDLDEDSLNEEFEREDQRHSPVEGHSQGHSQGHTQAPPKENGREDNQNS